MGAVAQKPTAAGPGWWLPVLGIAGGAACAKGVDMAHSVSLVRTLCHETVALHSLIPKFAGESSTPSCGSFDTRYTLGLILAGLGIAATVTAMIGLARRSRRAARAGQPWLLRRALRTAANWIDIHLPGGSGTQPRLRPGYLLALGVVLALVGLGAIQSALNQHEQRQEQLAYEGTQRMLATLALPATVRRKSSANCGAPVCGYSSLTPPELEPALARLLSAAPDRELTRLLPCPGTCPTLLRGELQGYPVVATIFWHLVIVRHGSPPDGAVPVPVPGPRRGGGLFYVGSDIDISAVQPNTGT